jgi:(1->4)-alpha-D-glucan 1-alpha-D-glucosylmutase
VTARALAVRARHRAAFDGGPYRAVATGTPNAVAYVRGEDVLVVVPRLTTQLVKPPRLPLGDVWRDLSLDVPGRWKNAFTGEALDSLALRDVFATFPVAILERVR